MKPYLLGLFLLPLLAACGGGSSSAPPATPQPIYGPYSPELGPTEAQSDSRQIPQPVYTPSAKDLLYVSNYGSNSITVYKHDANGNTPPQMIIAGSKTEINQPGALSEDAKGNLYVSNGPITVDSQLNFHGGNILVFAHGAHGNVAPIRRLSGPVTRLRNPEGLTVDQATGKIFVFNALIGNNSNAGQLLRFSPSATGNEAPFAASQANLQGTSQIASDSTGKFILESGNSGIFLLPKQFPDNADLSMSYHYPGSVADGGIADDPSTKTYLTAMPNGIYRLPEQFTQSTPTRVVYVYTCGTLAIGYLRNIYAHCSVDAINVYSPDASGNVPPLRVLKGPATKLNGPGGIYEGQ